MGWFDKQIKERKKYDDENLIDSIDEIAATILRKKFNSSSDDRKRISGAVEEIFGYYRTKLLELPEGIDDIEDQLEYLCRPYGIMRRTVKLERKWYKDAVGAFLAIRKDGRAVALIPNPFGLYTFFDEDKGKRVVVNAKTAKLFEEEAQCFYKPFPNKKLGIPSLIRFIIDNIPKTAIALMIAITFVITLVGMLSPKITNILFSEVIESGSVRLLLSISIFSVCVGLSSLLFGAYKSLINGRISAQLGIAVEAATMARVLSLPANFFRNYSAGELTNKVYHVSSMCSSIYSTFAISALTSLMSLIYIGQVFRYAPSLVVPSICVTLVTLAFSVLTTAIQMRETRKAMQSENRIDGMTYSIIGGMQKIKLAGAEKRVFARWAREYSVGLRHTYGIPKVLILAPAVSTLISGVGTIIMFFISVNSNIAVADYYSFTAAYGMVSGAFSGLVSMGLRAATIKPILEQIKPILEAEPEVNTKKKFAGKLAGGLELNNVTFRYTETMPYVLDDFSLKIRPGQYVAIVGKTGCGKSTLVRLLLGFEQPQKGAIYYDGKDISGIDMKSLRKNIGVVLQDGKLFSGDIFSNIVISAPWLSLDDAWEAAELAGIADDIRNMPMGMHTVLSEGGGTISGGQKQRIIIARAIAPKPKILIFDEATSALDNLTQKKVSSSLDTLKCTRIVIAHRLSTIRHCDRVVVLDGGRIVEDGTYDELIAKDGFFADLVRRQQIGG